MDKWEINCVLMTKQIKNTIWDVACLLVNEKKNDNAKVEPKFKI